MITAIPELPDVLFIEGAGITIDTIWTQKAIAKKIMADKDDYTLEVKK